MRLPKAILPIYLTTFVDTLGYTLLIPLLPAIAHKYGARDWVVGMLLSVPAACAMIAAPVWGKASDTAGRKPVIVIAQVFTLAGYTILALAGSLLWIFVSRIISGIGAGSIGTAQSYIADVTDESQRDRAYSVYGAVFGGAFIIGPVAAGLLQHYGLQFPFYVAAVIEASNIALTLWLLPAQTRKRGSETSARRTAKIAWTAPLRTVLLRQFLFIFAVVYLLADFALYIDHQLHENIPSVSWLLASTGAIGAFTLVVVVTPLAKRFGDRTVAQIGLVMLFASYSLIYFVTSLGWLFPVLVLWAIGASMVEPTLTAVLSRRAPQDERGAIMGVSDGVNSAALIVSPAIGAAIVGFDARLIGILPAIAVGAAWFIGRASAPNASSESRTLPRSV